MVLRLSLFFTQFTHPWISNKATAQKREWAGTSWHIRHPTQGGDSPWCPGTVLSSTREMSVSKSWQAGGVRMPALVLPPTLCGLCRPFLWACFSTSEIRRLDKKVGLDGCLRTSQLWRRILCVSFKATNTPPTLFWWGRLSHESSLPK